MRRRLEDVDLEALADQFAMTEEVTWTLLTAALVFFMQYGFALLETGMCRKNNTTATFTKNILDAMIGALVSLAYGYQLAYHVSPWNCAAGATKVATLICVRFFHHAVFQGTAATIVSGAMAERTTIHGYAIITLVVSSAYCFVVRWTWGGGWLHMLGFKDFAGWMVVHGFGGAAAVAGCAMVGAREAVRPAAVLRVHAARRGQGDGRRAGAVGRLVRL